MHQAGSAAGEAEAVRQAEKVAASVAAAAAAGRGCCLQAVAQRTCCPRSDMSPWLSAGCISPRRLLSILLARLQDTEGPLWTPPPPLSLALCHFCICVRAWRQTASFFLPWLAPSLKGLPF